MDDKSKARLIVKVFLNANKGKWYTAKELAEFINNHKLGVKGGVTSTSLSRIIENNVKRCDFERRRKNNKNVWEYAVV